MPFYLKLLMNSFILSLLLLIMIMIMIIIIIIIIISKIILISTEILLFYLLEYQSNIKLLKII